MTHCEKHLVDVVTDSSGDFVGYTGVLTGLLNRIHFDNTNLDSGNDISITIEDTGESLWIQNNVSSDSVIAPRTSTHISSGATATYASGGETVKDKIAIANSRIKIVIAQGGSVKTGKFYIYLE